MSKHALIGSPCCARPSEIRLQVEYTNTASHLGLLMIVNCDVEERACLDTQLVKTEQGAPGSSMGRQTGSGPNRRPLSLASWCTWVGKSG
jgi:hypothetical protein